MTQETYEKISKDMLTILVQNKCTVQEAENILHSLMRIIRETSPVQCVLR